MKKDYLFFPVGMTLFLLCVVIINQNFMPKNPVIIFCSPDLFYHERVMTGLQKMFSEKYPDIPVQVMSPIQRRDMTSLHNACQAMFMRKPRLIITPGIICSEFVINHAKRIGSTTPIIFVGVDDPVERGLINSLDEPGGNVTGTFSYDAESKVDQVAILKLVVPHVQRVLIPVFYSPTQNIEYKRAEEAKQKLEAMGKQATIVPIDMPNNAYMLVRGVAHRHDCIMVMDGTLLASQMSGIAKIAQREGIPMLTPVLDVRKSVTCSYGIDPIYPAQVAFDLAEKILAGANAGRIPVVRAFALYDLFINRNAEHAYVVENSEISRIEMEVACNRDYASVQGRVRMVEAC
jgi:ABC-type uncharacterized transport system substrate-binding protein